MAVPRTPSARLTDCPKINRVVWHLRCSVLRETPMLGPANLNFKKLNDYEKSYSFLMTTNFPNIAPSRS